MTLRTTNFSALSTLHQDVSVSYGPDVAGSGTTKHHHGVAGRGQETCTVDVTLSKFCVNLVVLYAI